MIYSSVISRLCPLLNADGVADLVFWTETELYAWLAEAAERLSRFRLYSERAEQDTEAGNASYELPVRTRIAVEVSLSDRVLRPATVAQLEARSSTWVSDVGAVDLVVLDARSALLWRTPQSAGTLAVTYFTWPNVTATDRYPHVLGDALMWSVLADARAKVSDAMAPDIAAQARERVRLYDAVFENYWGSW